MEPGIIYLFLFFALAALVIAIIAIILAKQKTTATGTLNDRGTWTSIDTYNINDFVYHPTSFSTYLSLTNNNINNNPALTLGTQWKYLARGVQGPAGPQGIPGPTGAAGQSILFSGFWNSGITYVLDDVVFNAADGSSYISIQNSNLNHPPSSSPSFWTPIALAGAPGSVGPTGPTGPQGNSIVGPTGPQGPTGPSPAALPEFYITSDMGVGNVQANGVINWVPTVNTLFALHDPFAMYNGSTIATIVQAGDYEVQSSIWGTNGSATPLRADMTHLLNGSAINNSAYNSAVVGEANAITPLNVLTPLIVESVFTGLQVGDQITVNLTNDAGNIGLRHGSFMVRKL